MQPHYTCVIHGSFGRFFNEIQATRELFERAGITVLAPQVGDIADTVNGFGRFANEVDQDPHLIELRYLHNLKQLGEYGFSYFICPEGYIGASTAYELGIAQATSVPIIFSHRLNDHPAYQPKNTILSPDQLVNYLIEHQHLPQPRSYPNQQLILRLWQQLIVPHSQVATGAIIEYQPRRTTQAKEVLLVKTHKWGNRYSIVGGGVKPGETLTTALLREIYEETGLRGSVGRHLCTFDQIKQSGYYRTQTNHIFVDNLVTVDTKQVRLNHEAESYIWAPVLEALRQLDIEPNARVTLNHYLSSV